MAHRFAEAFKYGPGDTLPPNYPWELMDQEVAFVTTDENGHIILTMTNQRVYTVPWDKKIRPPMRLDGSTRNWATETPFAEDVCVGDVLAQRWRVDRIYRLPNASPGTAGIDLTSIHGDNVQMSSAIRKGDRVHIDRIKMHRSHRGESVALRDQYPSRGPYYDALNGSIEYWFLVHPTGRGRWSSTVPEFMVKYEAGRYESRPPSRQSKDRGVWEMLHFGGDSDVSRHPNDPRYGG